MLKLFLQRIRFNLRNLFAKKIVVPTNFKSFEYTNPKYHQLLASYLLSNTDDDINYSKKIFGRETDDLVTSKDILVKMISNHTINLFLLISTRVM